MQRVFLKNLVWLQLLNWLVKPLWILGIEREMQMRLGDVWYGQYGVLFNLGVLFAVLLDAGLNTYISKEIASSGRLIHLKRILRLRLYLGTLYVLLVGIVGWYFSLTLELLAWVVLNQVLASIVMLLRAILQGRQRFISDSWLSVSDRLVALITCSLFLVFLPELFVEIGGIRLFLLAQFAGYAGAVLLGCILVFWKQNPLSVVKLQTFVSNNLNPSIDNSNPSIDNSALSTKNFSTLTNQFQTESYKQWLQKIAWFALMAFSMSVFTRIDIQMIRSFSPENNFFPGADNGFYQVGLYAKGYRLLDAALIFSTLLSTQLLPQFTSRITFKEDNTRLIWTGFRLVIWVAFAAALAAWFFDVSLMQLMYHKASRIEDEIRTTSQIFKVLMIAFIPMATVHVFGTYLTAAGYVRWLAILSLGCVVLNVVVNAIAIPRFGALAAAVGCVLTQFVFALASIVKTQRTAGFVWNKLHCKTLAYLVFIGLFSFILVENWLGLKSINGLVISTALYFVLAGYLLFRREIIDWYQKTRQIRS